MVVVASYTTLSVAANSISAEQVNNTYQYVGKGILTLYSRSSATGLNVSLKVNGVPLADDQPSPFFGTTGALSKKDHEICTVPISGGRLSLTYRNTTGGALTVDYILEFQPTK